MLTVDEMIEDILRREGGYVNHPDDRGGPTNFGITQETLDWLNDEGGHLLPYDVEDLKKDQAAYIYKHMYYDRPGINNLHDSVQPVAFDMSVNHGPRCAIKIIQKAYVDVAKGFAEIDGIIGPKTIKLSEDICISDIVYERISFYADIVANDHSQAVFLKGWLNRAREFL